MAINPEIHTFIHHLHVRRSLLEQRWMTKLQHLQTIQTCHCHRMPGKYGKVTSWHAAAFSDSAEPIPHTRPRPPRNRSSCIPNRCSWRRRLSSAPRPRPGNRDRSRLASSSRALPFKSWSLKSGEHMTFNSDIYLRHSRWYKIWKNNPEIHNFIQDISCWQMSFKHSIHSHQTQCRNLDPWVLYEEGFGYWAQLNTENKTQCFSKKRHCPFFWNLLFSFFPTCQVRDL